MKILLIQRMYTALLITAVVLFLSSCNRSGLAPGNRAPEIKLTTDSGSAFNFIENTSGKITLLSFWATWCAVCIEEMPHLESLYQKLKPHGFEVISVCVENDLQSVNAYREKFGITFPILVDSRGEASDLYKVNKFPEAFVINKEGKIEMFPDPLDNMPVTRIAGPRNWDSSAVRHSFLELLD